jgi:hypothetical protein
MANIYEKYAGLIPQLMPDPKQLQSLLSPQQTRLQAGLLGASSGVLPLMGVRDRPVGIGEVLLAAGTGAQAGLQQKEQSDLARALQGLELGSTLYEATRPPELSASDIMTFATPEGGTITLTTQEFAALPVEERSQLQKAQITGAPSEFGGQKAQTEMYTQIRDTGTFLSDIDSLVDLLKDPKTLTADIPKATVTAVDNLRQTVTQSLQFFSDPEKTKQISQSEFIRNNQDLLEEVAGQSDQLKSLYTTIAYSLAKSNNPDGRITDADFRSALDQIKGFSNNPQNMINLLLRYRERSENNLQTNLNLYNKINQNSGLPNSIYDLGITPYDYQGTATVTEDPLGIFSQ